MHPIWRNSSLKGSLTLVDNVFVNFPLIGNHSHRVEKILNVSREIDNFYPEAFEYYNVRVYDDDSTEMIKHWDKTYRIIWKAM